MAGSVLKDMTGEKYGSLTVLAFSHYDSRRQPYWVCSCVCGGSKTTRGSALRGGQATSCGCSRIKHGHNQMAKNGAPSRTYITWNAMLNRCTVPSNTNYKNYGGKGVTVCDSWHQFENFLSDMGERPEGKTLDRIKNELGYFKENCRWRTQQEQNQNQTTTVLTVEKAAAIKLDPRTQSVIAAEYGICQPTVSDIKRGKRWTNC